MKIPEKYKNELTEDLGNLSIENIWLLRNHLHLIQNYAAKDSGSNEKQVKENIKELLEVSSELYEFLIEMQASVTSADFTKMARLLNLGGGAVDAIEEIITSEDKTIPEIVMDGLALLITYFGNTAYISSALVGCETHISTHSIKLNDRMWSYINRFRKDIDETELEQVNETINTFFETLNNNQISIPQRVTLVTHLYQLLCMIHTASLIKTIEWEPASKIADKE